MASSVFSSSSGSLSTYFTFASLLSELTTIPSTLPWNSIIRFWIGQIKFTSDMPYSQTGETFIALSPLTNRFYRHSRCGLTLRVVKGRRELMKISSICEASDSQFFVCNPCMNLEMRNENHKNENSQGEPQNRSLALQVLSLKSRFQFSLFRNFQTIVFFFIFFTLSIILPRLNLKYKFSER